MRLIFSSTIHTWDYLDYFDCYRIKTLDMGVSPKKYALTVEEQMQVLQKAVQRRWDDMDFRYADIAIIKQFLGNIAKWMTIQF